MSIGNSLNAPENYPLASSEGIIVQNYGNETLIYNIKNNKMFHLNETSTLVWRFCNGRNSIERISREISRKLNNQTSEEIVRLALQQLRNDGLLDHYTGSKPDLNQISRRKIIGNSGLPDNNRVSFNYARRRCSADSLSSERCENAWLHKD